MNTPHRSLIGNICCCLLVIVVFAFPNARAGQYFQDFTSYAVGSTSFPDGSQLFSTHKGSVAAVVDSNIKELQLTSVGVPNTRSAYLLPDLDSGQPVYGFSAKWSAPVYAPFPTGADGFSFTFGQVGSLNLTNSTYFQESGYGAGVCFALHTFRDSRPGFYIMVNGTEVAYLTNSSANWGVNTDRRHFFEVDWNYFRGVTVRMDSQTLFANVAVTNFTPLGGDRFVWGARCGTETEYIRLDNIAIVTGGNYVQLPSRSPYYANNGAATNAFDGDDATFWGAAGAPPAYVGATFTPANAVALFALTSPNFGDNSGDPTVFTLDGSNDGGGGWTTCGSGSIYFAGRKETRCWPGTNSTAFGAYLLFVSQTVSSNYTLAGEVRLYAFSPAPPPGRANTAVAPSAFSATEANSGLSTLLNPWGNSRVYQMQFSPAVLGGLPVGARITGLNFRLNSSEVSSWPATSVTWSNDYQVTLAQAANAVSNMSTTFSANMISPVLVRNGPLTLASNSFTSGATPNAFGSLIVFDTPYVYQGGDLVMLFRHHGRDDSSPAPGLDAADEPTPGYRTNFRAFFSGSGFNATIGFETAVMIAQIEFGYPFFESEANDTKFSADSVGPMWDGDAIVGTTTGTSTSPGTASADNFLVTMAPTGPGIYRHRLVIESSTPGHTATIRGLTQTAGTVNPGTDATVQTSADGTSFNQFYTFGGASQFYYRVTGSVATSNTYSAVLETIPVVPMNLGGFYMGSINISTTNQVPSADTDIWVYDQNFNAIPGFGSDDGIPAQSLLIRNYPTGTYYLAISSSNLANEQASPAEDLFRNGVVMDFAGVAVDSNFTTNQNMTFRINDGARSLQVTNKTTGPFDINWFVFNVVPRPHVSDIFRVGTNLVIAGTGGSPFGTYRVVASTNIALPLVQWTPVRTNVFDGSGNFRYTNAIAPALPRRFFSIVLP